jgi:tetraacyldisaccharide 4'-kinase
MGAEVVAEQRHPDHHRFTAGEVRSALDAAGRAGCERVVTTEKDAVRLPPGEAADPRLAVVRISAELLAGGGLLDAALDSVLRSGGEGQG